MKFAPERIRSLQRRMREAEIDVALIGPSADMFYLVGGRLPLTERLNLLMVPNEGSSWLIVPNLQAPLVDALSAETKIRTWSESDDPLSMVAQIVRDFGARRVAVNGQLWASFLIGLQQRLSGVGFHDVSALMSANRIRKDAAEIELMTDAAARFDAVWEQFFATGRLTGETEHSVAARIGQITLAHGFDTMLWCDVGSGPNGASPLHHGSHRRIEAGDPVVIDFAAVRNGYVMDTCRTPVAGVPQAEFVAIYDVVNRAYEAGAHAVRPGVAAEAVDRAARDVIERAGYGPQFMHRLGHGLGIDAHEEPYIVSGNRAPLEAGMIFSNEPGIYVPGRWGVRIENILLVTERGGHSLSRASRELVSMQ